MKITITNVAPAGIDAKPSGYALLCEPPRYKGEKQGPIYSGAIRLAGSTVCPHVRSGHEIDATLEWDTASKRYTAVSAECSDCKRAPEQPRDERVVRCKVTNWAGRYGFAAPLLGQASDVQTVFFHVSGLCSHLAPRYNERLEWSYESNEYVMVEAGATHVKRDSYITAIGLTHDAAKNRHSAGRAVCDACAPLYKRGLDADAIQAKRDAARAKLHAMFPRGHRFDVGGMYPVFYKPGAVTDAVLAAFEGAVIDGLLTDASDVTERAEKKAREVYAARMQKEIA